MTDTVESPESTEVPASEPDMRSAQEQADSAVTEWAAQLPWWRRPRQMRRQLSVSLSLVSLVSVLLVGGLNFFAASDLLREGTEEQVIGVAESRARSIEEGASRLLSRVAALSSDLGVAVALSEFIEGYDGLSGESLSDEELDALEAFYKTDFVDPLAEVDVEITAAELLPQSDAGRYLQSTYIVEGGDDPASVDDAGDGTDYSAAHAEHHPYLRDLVDTLVLDDIKFVNADADVVYSVAKLSDIGTNLVDGPYADSVLGQTLLDRLSRARAGDAVMSDFEIYLPNLARPTGFAMATVRSGTDLLGAMVAEIPIDALNSITTADGAWSEVGLDEGESYLVGSDSILRSESRLWLEDPEAYLDRIDDELLARRIEFLGSPVGIQPADTEPVRVALDGEIFDGRASNYVGQDVYSYARLIDVAGVNWVVVADIPYDDARSPLYSYLIRIGITLLILLPLAALIGVAMATRVTEPIPKILGAADDVVHGERDPDLPDFGRNELGDLARRLRRTAARLGTQEADLESQFEETRSVLLSALPPSAVRDGVTPSTDADRHDIGTAISIAIDLTDETHQIDDSLGDLLATASRVAEELAADRGIERVRAAADRYLFVAGLDEDDTGADRALDLAAEIARRTRAFAEREEIDLNVRVGVSTGAIETGLMSLGNLSYTAWGDPIRNAMVIGSLATGAVVGVDESTVRAADSNRWVFADAPEVIGFDEQPLSVFALDDIGPAD